MVFFSGLGLTESGTTPVDRESICRLPYYIAACGRGRQVGEGNFSNRTSLVLDGATVSKLVPVVKSPGEKPVFVIFYFF